MLENAFELLPQNNIEIVAKVYVKNDVCVCGGWCVCTYVHMFVVYAPASVYLRGQKGMLDVLIITLCLILSDKVSH